jgi:hypothetical protein
MHDEESDWSTPEYWLARAKRVRAIAAEISDLQLQKRLLDTASKYEKVAKQVQDKAATSSVPQSGIALFLLGKLHDSDLES